jgi:hypothetical protein
MMSPLPAGGVVEAIKADRRKLSRKLIGNRQPLDRSTMGWFCSQFSHLLAFWVSPGDREGRPVSVKAKDAGSHRGVGLEFGSWGRDSAARYGQGVVARRIASDPALVIIFRERANAGRRSQDVGFDLGLARDDGDGPPRRDAQLAFQDRSNVARDRRSARLDGGYPTIELRDAETPDFLLVGRLKRKHAALFCCCNYRR